MSIADDFAAVAPFLPQDRCHACDRLSELEGRDREALAAALHDKKSPTQYLWAAKEVAKVARRNGLMLPEANVREHRNEEHGA